MRKQAEDITGRIFGRLTVLKPTEERSGHALKWLCRCSCGKVVSISASALKYGDTNSCGCLASEVHKEVFGIAMKARQNYYVDGTDIMQLSRSPSAANTSGVRGVSWDKSVRTWKAYITFKGHRYFLGSSTDFETVVAYRREAEKRIHGKFLEWYCPTHPDKNAKKRTGGNA